MHDDRYISRFVVVAMAQHARLNKRRYSSCVKYFRARPSLKWLFVSPSDARATLVKYANSFGLNR